MKKTRILIADDHEVVRRGVAAMLSAHSDLEVCCEAPNGREAVDCALQLQPDIVVMDITMPEMNGLEATRQILKDNPKAQVLILTLHESEELIRNVLTAGARGYVLKSDVAGNLVSAVRALQQRQLFFTSKIADVVMRGYLTGGMTSPAPAGNDPLSPREREVVQLIAEGKSNKEVAAILDLSIKTVETHRANIMDKLNLHSVADLVRYAVRNHIIETC
jgi:DNA-binding NarL/FixJ family response regulator